MTQSSIEIFVWDSDIASWTQTWSWFLFYGSVGFFQSVWSRNLGHYCWVELHSPFPLFNNNKSWFQRKPMNSGHESFELPHNLMLLCQLGYVIFSWIALQFKRKRWRRIGPWWAFQQLFEFGNAQSAAVSFLGIHLPHHLLVWYRWISNSKRPYLCPLICPWFDSSFDGGFQFQP